MEASKESGIQVKHKLPRLEFFKESRRYRKPSLPSNSNTESQSASCPDEDKQKEKIANIVNVDPDSADPQEAWKRLRKGQRIREIERQKWTAPVPEGCMRFVCISDTHSKVEGKKNFYLPDGDVLLFAGDMTMSGSPEEIAAFNKFIGQFPHRDKIVIAGNHDFSLDGDMEPLVERKKQQVRQGVVETTRLLTNCTFIQDELVEVAGIKIYGSPWVPIYGSPAFSLYRGEDLLNKWNQIPEYTDILMTHAPPLGIGDKVPGGFHVGCVELLNSVQHRVKPQYHVFGHIHEGYGMYTDGTTKFINASTCATGYQPTQRPIVFDVQIPEGHFKTESLNHCVSLRSSLPDCRPDNVFDPQKKES